MNFVKETKYGLEKTDAVTNFLNEENAVLITGDINESTTLDVVSNLYYWAKKDPDQLIKVYIINSPGGSVTAATAILDVARLIPNPIRTIGIGLVASAASLLLSSLATEKRLVTENVDLLYHQPLTNGIQGQASDVVIAAERLIECKQNINQLLASVSNLSVDQVEKLLDRDCWVSPKEAMDMGLIDGLLQWTHFNTEE